MWTTIFIHTFRAYAAGQAALGLGDRVGTAEGDGLGLLLDGCLQLFRRDDTVHQAVLLGAGRQEALAGQAVGVDDADGAGAGGAAGGTAGTGGAAGSTTPRSSSPPRATTPCSRTRPGSGSISFLKKAVTLLLCDNWPHVFPQ